MGEEKLPQGLTIKVKLLLKKPADETKFCHTMEQLQQACNFVSQCIFENNFPLNYMKLNKDLYATIRSKFGLKSQLTQSAIKETIPVIKPSKNR